jgi:hypothetical protein
VPELGEAVMSRVPYEELCKQIAEQDTQLKQAWQHIAELEAELKYVIRIAVAESDTLDVDQLNYLMSAREVLEEKRE